MFNRFRATIPLIAVLFLPLITRADTYVLREKSDYAYVQSSDHFAVMWNDIHDISFSVSQVDTILDVLESLRDYYYTKTLFPEPYTNEEIKYKMNVYIITTGWSLGGGDAGHPALFVHPDVFRNKWAVAHEYVSSLQFATDGFRGNAFVGWFWKSHAEWMSHQLYPNETHCAEKYTRNTDIHYGSMRNTGCNWQFLEYLKETEGIGFLARLWSDGWPDNSLPQHADEDFFSAIMRLKGWDFAKLGDVWGTFAMRMARYDFANGAVYRALWERGRPDWQMRLTRTPLETVDSTLRRYVVPDAFAPQRYGYNIVRLRREPGQTRVRVAFQGIKQDRSANPGYMKSRPDEPESISGPGSGWRFGLVAVDTVRTTFRYSPVMASGEVSLNLSAAESEVYLVVAATPTNRQLIQGDQPYYTIYRYPWMCEMQGAWPDGLQPGGPQAPAGVAGALHPNGGGFVAATATVEATAFVGPAAMVLGTAKVQGQARLEGRAVVGGTGEVRDQAVISGYAGVWAGQVFDSARIDGAAQVSNAGTKISGRAHLGGRALSLDEANLSGTVQFLGDAEILALSADHGVFYGFVGPQVVANPGMGEERAAPESEITVPGPYLWDNASSVLKPLSAGARNPRQARFLSLSGEGKLPIAGVRDVTGRRAFSPASGRHGSLLPDGVFFLRP